MQLRTDNSSIELVYIKVVFEETKHSISGWALKKYKKMAPLFFKMTCLHAYLAYYLWLKSSSKKYFCFLHDSCKKEHGSTIGTIGFIQFLFSRGAACLTFQGALPLLDPAENRRRFSDSPAMC